MPINGPRPLFVYLLGIATDAERASASLYDFLSKRVRDEQFAALLRELEQSDRKHLAKIGVCLDAVGLKPLQTPSPVAEGLRKRFDTFVSAQPVPEVVDLFAYGTVVRSERFGIANYEELCDVARLIHEPKCEETLCTIITTKRNNLDKVERIRPRLNERLMATV
jgi:ferritin-like metal-binding protein YciE